MKNKSTMRFGTAAVLLLGFVLWTVVVCTVDVAAIGPRGSVVGLAALNGAFHRLTGVHFTLYHLTDWLGLVPVAVGFGFAVLGLVQWIGRKSLRKVDYSLFVLGGFYIVVAILYLVFEECVINYRPVLINDFLEASYPSSTTLLVLCVMPAAMLQWQARLKRVTARRWITAVTAAFTMFMVIGRLLSGVHWFSDIVGGVLLSAALVAAYRAVVGLWE